MLISAVPSAMASSAASEEQEVNRLLTEVKEALRRFDQGLVGGLTALQHIAETTKVVIKRRKPKHPTCQLRDLFVEITIVMMRAAQPAEDWESKMPPAAAGASASSADLPTDEHIERERLLTKLIIWQRQLVHYWDIAHKLDDLDLTNFSESIHTFHQGLRKECKSRGVPKKLPKATPPPHVFSTPGGRNFYVHIEQQVHDMVEEDAREAWMEWWMDALHGEP